jgi:hypothetical protein
MKPYDIARDCYCRFSSQFINKIWYGLFGGREIIAPTNRNLSDHLTIWADGVEIVQQEPIEGLILSNIPSYGGGARLWARPGARSGEAADMDDEDDDEGSSDSEEDATEGASAATSDYSVGEASFDDTDDAEASGYSTSEYASPTRFKRKARLPRRPQTQSRSSKRIKLWKPESFQDGLLEIVSVQGSFHLAQIQLGLCNATRLAQAQEIVIHIHKNSTNDHDLGAEGSTVGKKVESAALPQLLKVPLQIDGEPWLESAGCTITVRRMPESAQCLQYHSPIASKYASIATEVIEWGYRTQLLNQSQRKGLLLECSRRLEMRNRVNSVINDAEADYDLMVGAADVLPLL